MAIQPIVEVQDQFGNSTNSNAEISVAVVNDSSNKGQLSGGDTTIGANNGEASFTNLVFEGLINTNYTLQFTASGLAPVTADSIRVSKAGKAFALQKSSNFPTSSTHYDRINMDVVLTDKLGNPISKSGQTISFAVPSGGVGEVASSDSQTNGDGIAETTWTLGLGENKLQAEAIVNVDNNTTSTLSTEFIVNAQATMPTQLVITTPPTSNVTSGQALTQVIVQLQDQQGRPTSYHTDDDGWYVSVVTSHLVEFPMKRGSQHQAKLINGVATFNNIVVEGDTGGSFQLEFIVLNTNRRYTTISDTLTMQ